MNKVLAALVPIGVVTKTLAVPAVPAGVVAVMIVELNTVTLVAATPPMASPCRSVTTVLTSPMVAPPPLVAPYLLMGQVL